MCVYVTSVYVSLCPIFLRMTDSLDVVQNIGLFKKTIKIHQACATSTELFCCLNKGCRSKTHVIPQQLSKSRHVCTFSTKCNFIKLLVNFKREQIMNTPDLVHQMI